MDQQTQTDRRALQRIFIASSQEASEFAKNLARRLTELDAGLLPVPWWESFKLGRYTFEDLTHQARVVDGAIIIAAKDDKVWYRQKSGERPRDNVIFEFGIFASRLGLKRTIVLAEEGVELPSDIRGVTFLSLKDQDIEQTAHAVMQHFTDEFGSEQSSEIAPFRVVCHPDLAALQISQKLPDGWLMRAMYLGTDGARAWLATTTDTDYESAAQHERFSQDVLKMLDSSNSTFRTYVSLGPGDAQVDSAISLALLQKEPTAQCIPVDLSDGLLWHAIKILSRHVRVPVGLLVDFEENFKFILRLVREYGKGPYLYGLFGNTFGNLDKPETKFVAQLNTYMGSDDELMLDVAVVKDGEKSDKTKWGDGTKLFFAHGASRHLKICAYDVLSRFDELITVKRSDTGGIIPGTELMTVFVEGRLFALARRYNFNNLVEFFEAKGFQTKSQLLQIDGPYNIGLLSLRKKPAVRRAAERTQ